MARLYRLYWPARAAWMPWLSASRDVQLRRQVPGVWWAIMRARIRRAALTIKAKLEAVTLLEFLLSAAMVVIVNRWLGIPLF